MASFTFSFTLSAVLLVLMLTLTFMPLHAQAPAPLFGTFEAPLPGLEKTSIDDLVNQKQPLTRFVAFLVNFGTAMVIVLGLMGIVIGGYFYMTAAGGSGVETGKKWIFSALLGIALALAAYLILNTINPQLVGG